MTVEQEELAKELVYARRTVEQQASETEQIRRSNQELEQRVKRSGEELERRLAESNALSQVAAAISSVMEVQRLLEMIMGKSRGGDGRRGELANATGRGDAGTGLSGCDW